MRSLQKLLPLLLIFILSFNCYAVEIKGQVTRIFKANNTVKSEFDKICVTFIKNEDGREIGIVEDYYFCTLARKYQTGELLVEEVQKNIIIAVEDIEPELNSRLQKLDKNSFYIILDY